MATDLVSESKAHQSNVTGKQNDQIAGGEWHWSPTTDCLGWPFEGWTVCEAGDCECIREPDGRSASIVGINARCSVLFGATFRFAIGRFEFAISRSIH